MLIGIDLFNKLDMLQKTGHLYILEIYICFDKSLILTDCNGIKNSHDRRNFRDSNMITNCPLGNPILYPSRMPSVKLKPV